MVPEIPVISLGVGEMSSGLDERTKELVMKRVISRVKDIPSLPDAVLKALKMLNDPKSNAADVAEILSRDEGLTVRILKLANSAYYGLPRQVTNLSEAVAILGFKTVKSIVLAASVYTYVNKGFDGYALQRGDLWRHSLAVALVSKMVAERKKSCDPEEAFIAGVLHDIGKIVLSEYVRFGFSLIMKMAEEEQVPFMEAERRVLGFDHAEIGGKIIEQWNLPPVYAAVARFHHEPDLAPQEHSKVVDTVHVSNLCVLMLGVGIGSDGLLYPLSERALSNVGIESMELLMSDAVDLLVKEDLMSLS